MASLYPTQVEADELRGQAWTREELIEEFQDDARDAYQAKEEEVGSDLMREVERYLILQVVDARWREHLDAMEYLREGIHLRAMAQKDPLSEYRAEGHALFQELTATIREEVLRLLFHATIQREDAAELVPAGANGGRDGNLVYEHESLAGADAIAAAGAGAGVGAGAPATAPARAAAGPATGTAVATQRIASEEEKLGRNDPCWCGSGKKYKKCHGA